ncbi:MAG: hypothetical protein ACFFCI_08035 [Promethearchaeota archaeon]
MGIVIKNIFFFLFLFTIMEIIELKPKTMEENIMIMKIVNGYEELEKIKSQAFSKLMFRSPIIW